MVTGAASSAGGHIEYNIVFRIGDKQLEVSARLPTTKLGVEWFVVEGKPEGILLYVLERLPSGSLVHKAPQCVRVFEEENGHRGHRGPTRILPSQVGSSGFHDSRGHSSFRASGL